MSRPTDPPSYRASKNETITSSLFSNVAQLFWVVCIERANPCYAIFRKSESLNCPEPEAYILAEDHKLEILEINVTCGNCGEGVITLFDYVTQLLIDLKIMTFFQIGNFGNTK
jgi:hypothetical protein